MTLLYGYASNTEVNQSPENNSVEYITATIGTARETLYQATERVILTGAPASIKVFSSAVSSSPFCILDIINSAETEGLIQATITAVAATASGVR